MSDERLRDEDVAWYAGHTRTYYSTTPNATTAAKALAREVQEWRAAAKHFPVAYFPPLGDLCARHDITVEGIVALVDDVFRGELTEPEHANVTEAMEDGLHREDMYYAGWEVGYYDSMTYARRLARGEDA